MERRNSPWKRGFERFARNRAALFCAVVLAVIIGACIAAPLITPYDPIAMDIKNVTPPSPAHPFGTDQMGRDILSRILYGGRTTFKVTFGAVLVSLIGAAAGIVSGYYGGRADRIISGIADGLSAVPTFLMTVVIELAFGWGRGYFMYALGIAMIPAIFRLSRNLTYEVCSLEYIEAARALGVGSLTVIRRHIIRNIGPQLIVHIAGSVGDAMINCTILGYLGVGIQIPAPEWGNIIASGFKVISTHSYYITISCIICAAAVLCIAIVGNGLRDAFAAYGREEA